MLRSFNIILHILQMFSSFLLYFYILMFSYFLHFVFDHFLFLFRPRQWLHQNPTHGEYDLGTEHLVRIVQSLVERVWVGVAIQIKITPQAINQAFVVGVVAPDAAVGTADPVPEVHEIVACGAEHTPSEVRQVALIIGARLRLERLHHHRDFIDNVAIRTT